MKTEETINTVCSELGISKAELAKRMGILPSSLYRKLARESMTFEELQRCLDMLGVTIEFQLRYPNGNVQSSQVNHEMLLEKNDLLEKELEAARNAAEFHKKILRDMRTALNSVVGYTELYGRHRLKAEEYPGKIQAVLSDMQASIAYAIGESANEEPEEYKPESVAALVGKRVLLVDDNQLNRELLREILTDHGLAAEEACNGSEAVKAVMEREPACFDFILMDIEMPVMDGYEATMRIRKLPDPIRANIPIVALTANAVAENRERAASVGMDDFLTKPAATSRLLGSLAKLMKTAAHRQS